MKKFAFTLAEVLITLTIIGVISAMVLPNMLGHWEKKALENQTKHFYSMLTLAIQNYMADQHVDDLADTSISCNYNWDNCREAEEEVHNFINRYLKVALKCRDEHDKLTCTQFKCNKYGNKSGLLYKVIDKRSDAYGCFYPDYILAHGYAIRMQPADAYGTASVQFDVNGTGGPNRGGRDLWDVYIYYDGSIDELSPEARANEEYAKNRKEYRFERCKESSYDGSGCFAHFKDNGFKFDY